MENVLGRRNAKNVLYLSSTAEDEIGKDQEIILDEQSLNSKINRQKSGLNNFENTSNISNIDSNTATVTVAQTLIDLSVSDKTNMEYDNSDESDSDEEDTKEQLRTYKNTVSVTVQTLGQSSGIKTVLGKRKSPLALERMRTNSRLREFFINIFIFIFVFASVSSSASVPLSVSILILLVFLILLVTFSFPPL